MHLRMWSDSIPQQRTIELDPGIITEHWTPSELTPSELIADGHTVLNAASALYHNASGPRISATNLCGPDPVGDTTLLGCVSLLWEEGWHPGLFEDETVDPSDPAVLGAKLSLWPGYAMSENEVQANVFMPLRFVSQRTWGSTEPFISYSQFTDRAEALGDPPGWAGWNATPVPAGQYLMRVTLDGAAVAPAEASADSVLEASGEEELWQLLRTDDDYYEIISGESGLCVGISGYGPGSSPAIALREGSTEQKWDLAGHENAEGFLVTSAATQLDLMLAADGRTLVQVEPHEAESGSSAWQFDLITPATIRIEGPEDGIYLPGATTPVAATFTNAGESEATDLALVLVVPDNWQVTSTSDTEFAEVGPGSSVTAQWEITLPEDLAAGAYPLGVEATFTDRDGEQSFSQNLQVETSPPGSIPHPRLSVVDFSSEQEGSGEAEYAIDGDPALPWHTEWWEVDPVPDFPHFISVDLGARYEVDALSYMPKQGGNTNGAVKDYIVAISEDGETWQDVASGAFVEDRDASDVSFGPIAARYVWLTGLSALNGGPHMAAEEIRYFGTPLE